MDGCSRAGGGARGPYHRCRDFRCRDPRSLSRGTTRWRVLLHLFQGSGSEAFMSMPQERRAAVALLIGVVAPLLIMGMHPTGGDITRGGARLVMINHWVHGVALAAQPVVFLGLLRSEEHTSELQSQSNLVCRLLLEKKKNTSHPPIDAISP